jgi:hypothetical protein
MPREGNADDNGFADETKMLFVMYSANISFVVDA